MEGKILVFNATGKQGKAVVEELCKGNYKVRAVTRKISSKKAQKLSGKEIEIVEIDYSSQESLQKVLVGVTRVFFLLPMSKDSETVGKNIIKAIKKAKIEHIVFSSVGGADRKTGIAHFELKWRIEENLRNSGVPWTILRPAAYMEELCRIKGAGIILGLLSCFVPPDKKIQMISITDIAKFVKISFENPKEFIGKAIEIAGDALTLKEMISQLNRISPKPIRVNKWTRLLVPILPKIMKEMLTFYGKDGWQADLKEMKRINPEGLTVEKLLAKKPFIE